MCGTQNVTLSAEDRKRYWLGGQEKRRRSICAPPKRSHSTGTSYYSAQDVKAKIHSYSYVSKIHQDRLLKPWYYHNITTWVIEPENKHLILHHGWTFYSEYESRIYLRNSIFHYNKNNWHSISHLGSRGCRPYRAAVAIPELRVCLVFCRQFDWGRQRIITARS